MPLAFPSHVGLVAPLWRRWPHRFDALALGIGAVMPDVVDGMVGLARGQLGQGLGHSILGLVPCVVLGALVWLGLMRRKTPPGRLLGSLTVGALSHVVSDLVSHDGGPLFYPLPRWHPFPAWWSDPWFFMPVPGYPGGYPFAPHFLVWCVITVVGAWLLVASARALMMRGPR